jgi:hypothetical protein
MAEPTRDDKAPLPAKPAEHLPLPAALKARLEAAARVPALPAGLKAHMEAEARGLADRAARMRAVMERDTRPDLPETRTTMDRAAMDRALMGRDPAAIARALRRELAKAPI